MKYVNAKGILPEELLNQIMEYVDGKYIYIPKKESKRTSWGENTVYRQEMNIRNRNIFEHYLIGMNYVEISEMYHLSEKSIRRIVLKERRRMEIEQLKVEKILEAYGIYTKPKQIYLSTWDVENQYVLKKYTNIYELKRNLEITKILSEQNIPVQNVVRLSEEKEYFECDNEYWVLLTKLKGNNIVHIKECDYNWFFQMGGILAKLHLAFNQCEDRINYWNNSLVGEMESWVLENISQQKLDYITIEDVCSAIKKLKDVYTDLPKGLIHRDVHLGNFLFYENQFSGYIDFDLSQKNIRIFDLCYFMLGLLLEEEENKVNENQWFEYLRWLVKGYDSKITLSKIERDNIAVVMENIELLFVGYFIGEQDDKAARDSAELFYFCKRNEEKIKRYVNMI